MGNEKKHTFSTSDVDVIARLLQQKGFGYRVDRFREENVSRVGNSVTSTFYFGGGVSRRLFLKTFRPEIYSGTGLIDEGLLEPFRFGGKRAYESTPEPPEELCGYEARVLQIINGFNGNLAPQLVGVVGGDRLLMEFIGTAPLRDPLVEAYRGIQAGINLKKHRRRANTSINRGLRTVARASVEFNNGHEKFGDWVRTVDYVGDQEAIARYLLTLVSWTRAQSDATEPLDIEETRRELLKPDINVSPEYFANSFVQYLRGTTRDEEAVLVHGDSAPHHITSDKRLLDLGNFRRDLEQYDLVRLLRSPLTETLEPPELTKKILIYLTYKKVHEGLITEGDLQGAQTANDLYELLERHNISKQHIRQFIRTFYDVALREHLHMAAATPKYPGDVVRHIVDDHPKFGRDKSLNEVNRALITWYMGDMQAILNILLSNPGRKLFVTDPKQQDLLEGIRVLGERCLFPEESLVDLLNGRSVIGDLLSE